MLTIQNPNFPAEIDEIETIMHDLMDCQVRNRFNMAQLDKWLTDKPDLIFNALLRLRESMEQVYPPTVLTSVQANKEAEAA